jgi:hypothetical protein
MLVFKNLFLLTFFFIILGNYANASEEHNPMFKKNWKLIGTIDTTDFQKTFKQISEMDIDIAGVDISAKKIDVLLTDFDYKNLQRKGLSVEVKETKGVTRGPDQEYKNPEEILEIMTKFASAYPELTQMHSIGKSLEGRDIWAMKISDNPNLTENDEPAVLFNSMHHAREVMTPEVSLDIIEQLLTNYATDAEVASWVNSIEIWVIPMFNVDGNNKMWNHDRWWRKNTRGGYGVDLNRNYPTGWNKCKGSSASRRSQTYRGPNPASEPETQAMMNFIKNIRPVFDISYHAYSELVIYPFGCSPERTPTKDVVETIGKEIAKKLNYKAGTAWELLYNADGGDIDWMYDAYQVIPYVIELNSRKQGFHPKYKKWRDVTVEKNRVGWQHLLNRVTQSGIRGQLTNKNKIVQDYTIEISNEDNLKVISTYRGHEKSGMFHLVLNPGTYTLNFKVNSKIIKSEKVVIGNELELFNIRL